jgi:transposase-like protein
MPNPWSPQLRDRAVRAYDTGNDAYTSVARRFSIGERTLRRWVRQWRTTGTVTPRDKAGGWTSPVNVAVMHAVVAGKPDSTTDELTRAYNATVSRPERVHRSSFLRALRRAGYVFKKNVRGPQSRTAPTSAPSARRSGPGRRI